MRRMQLGFGARAGFALVVLWFVMSAPAVQAQEEGAAGGFPEVFTAPPPGIEMSDETVVTLRALTGVARLQRMAAADAGLDALKYSDPNAALAAAGAELPPEVEVSIRPDDETGGDEVTVVAFGESTRLRFDAEGHHVEEPRAETASRAAGFAPRGECTNNPQCEATLKCFTHTGANWGAMNFCTTGGSRVCTAWRYSDGLTYHVPCEY